MGFLGDSAVKKLPAMQETRVGSLGWEYPLEKEMDTHSSILIWRIPWTEDLGMLPSMVFQRVGHDWVTNTFFFHKYNHLVGISHKVSQFSLYISEKMHKAQDVLSCSVVSKTFFCSVWFVASSAFSIQYSIA